MYVAFVVVGLPPKLLVVSTTRLPDASSDHDCVVSIALPLKLTVVVMTSLLAGPAVFVSFVPFVFTS